MPLHLNERPWLAGNPVVAIQQRAPGRVRWFPMSNALSYAEIQPVLYQRKAGFDLVGDGSSSSVKRVLAPVALSTHRLPVNCEPSSNTERRRRLPPRKLRMRVMELVWKLVESSGRAHDRPANGRAGQVAVRQATRCSCVVEAVA